MPVVFKLAKVTAGPPDFKIPVLPAAPRPKGNLHRGVSRKGPANPDPGCGGSFAAACAKT